MPDLTVISTALTSLKTAAEITKFLRDSDLSIEKAEMKLKLADLVSALADARMQLTDVQELLRQKDARIAELEEAFETKDKLIRHSDAYYETDESGKPIGRPYCLSCWETKKKRRQLVANAQSHRQRECADCGHLYPGFRVPMLSADGTEIGA